MVHRRGREKGWRGTLRGIGRRGWFLFTLGILDLLYGFSILVQASGYFDKQYLLLSSTAWGWIWIAFALVMICQAFRHVDRVGYALAVVLKCAWATVALYDWVFIVGDVRGWETAVLWFALAILTAIVADWPEHHNPPEIGAFNGEPD